MHKLIPKTIYDDLMETISYHTFYLAKDLYGQLKDLQHLNGNKATVLYMDSDFTDIKKQGGTVTFNLLREDGSYIGYAEVRSYDFYFILLPVLDVYSVCSTREC